MDWESLIEDLDERSQESQGPGTSNEVSGTGQENLDSLLTKIKQKREMKRKLTQDINLDKNDSDMKSDSNSEEKILGNKTSNQESTSGQIFDSLPLPVRNKTQFSQGGDSISQIFKKVGKRQLEKDPAFGAKLQEIKEKSYFNWRSDGPAPPIVSPLDWEKGKKHISEVQWWQLLFGQSTPYVVN